MHPQTIRVAPTIIFSYDLPDQKLPYTYRERERETQKKIKTKRAYEKKEVEKRRKTNNGKERRTDVDQARGKSLQTAGSLRVSEKGRLQTRRMQSASLTVATLLCLYSKKIIR